MRAGRAATLLVSCCLLAGTLVSTAEEVHSVVLEPTKEIYRARVHFLEDAGQATTEAVLVLCPGQNVDGASLLNDPVWRELASKENLQLAAIYFYSPDEVLDDFGGYFRAERESAEMLNDALQQRGLGNLPLLLYGFSGGAFFVNNYAQTHPERVLAWCAMAVSRWERAELAEDKVRTTRWLATPGLLACGDRDEPRYGATKLWFQKHRRLGARWTWISLEDHPHHYHDGLERFAAAFFTEVLTSPTNAPPVYADITTSEISQPGPLISHNQLETWLPNENLFPAWRELHAP